MQLDRRSTETEDDSSEGWFDGARGTREAQARQAARRRASDVKQRVGQAAFDALEEQFPEQARARRRKDGAVLFAVGVAVGVLARHLLDRS